MNIKEFFTYITNQLKFWIIVKDWEYGLHLRSGKIRRELKSGIYFKVPFLDFYYTKPNRILDVYVSHINCLTKDFKNITISATIFYKIISIKKYYLGYSEPNSIIAQILKNELNKYISKIDSKDITINSIEDHINKELKQIKEKGLEFNDSKVLTISNARTYRIIKDNLYSQGNSFMDEQSY